MDEGQEMEHLWMNLASLNAKNTICGKTRLSWTEYQHLLTFKLKKNVSFSVIKTRDGYFGTV